MSGELTNSDSCFVAKIDVLFGKPNFAKEVLMGSFGVENHVFGPSEGKNIPI